MPDQRVGKEEHAVDELGDLQEGESSFPEAQPVEGGAKCGQEVVEVHEDVHYAIDLGKHDGGVVRMEATVAPSQHGHDGVMEELEKRTCFFLD